MDVYAQPDWKEHTGVAYTVSTSKTVSLKADVKLTQPILIKKDATLTINNGATKDVNIYNGQAAVAYKMFEVESGGKLVISGRSATTRIVIDGGADFPDWTPETGLDKAAAKKTLNCGILNHGTMSLNHVCIQNVCGTNNESANSSNNNSGGAIEINSQWATGKPCGPTTIKNSIIRKCLSPMGSAIGVSQQNQGTQQTPDNCNITISDSEIYHCHATGTGGTIRTSGAAMAHLYLTRNVIHHNRSANGGGLYWNAHGHNDTKCFINGCTFSDNVATSKGGGMMLETSFEFTGNPTVIENNTAESQGGGIFINGYNGGLIEGGNIEMMLNDKVIVKNNTSAYGGGISFYFSQMSFTKPTTINAIINGCTVSDNTATDQGGAICFRNLSAQYEQKTTINIGIKMESGTFEKNTAANYGGAIYVDNTNITYTSPQAASAMITMKENKVTGSAEAGDGGGLYLKNGSLTMGKATFQNNTVTRDGGAIYITGGTLTIGDSATIQDNTSGRNGGGIWVEGGDFIVTSSIEVARNYANNQGGGIVVESGNINFQHSDIYQNRAGYDTSNNIVNANASGGAISVNQGSITINEGDIYDNYSTKNGGAIYANNSDFSTAAKTISLVGSGLFQKNNSTYGGGMYVSGNIEMTFAGNIINNRSVNGGGLFLANGAKLTIIGGILKQNKASGIEGKTAPSTGYQVSSANLHGMGGGVYLDSGKDASHPTNLIFALTGDSIGLYDNEADWGADDIFANGLNTTVTLPDIDEMTFVDFDTPADTPLYWAEDYITDDPNYGYGTKEKLDWDSDKTNERYDFAIRNSRPTYHITFTDDTKVLTSYISLEVGYELIFITLVKKGLSPGENATFTFTPALHKVSDTEYAVVEGTKPYQTIIFICKTSDQTANGVVKRMAITRGWWKIDETSWSWAYDPDNGTAYDKPILIDNVNNKYLEFVNTRKSDIPPTSESVVTNHMKSSVTTVSAE